MQIGTYFGIPLKVNPFFLLLLAAALALGLLPQALLLFAVVFWHETFHVILAKLYKLDVLEVELLPFGGVARLDALLQMNPEAEWVIAVIGPLSNLLLISLGFLIQPRLNLPPPWFDFFIEVNWGMAFFNLLPALPLDGGRVLRSILVRRHGFKRATDLAARIGQGLSAVLVLWGGLGFYRGWANSLIFTLAGILLFSAARKEQKTSSYVFMRYLTAKKQELRLKRVLSAEHLVATKETSLGEILRHFQPPRYHFVWVIDLDGKITGFLSELDLISALLEQGLSVKVGDLVVYRI
ncbi:MAG: CBS domain-containing protein [Firmicutes bacterium]|nr:CBS domain-containing protein [Bacillota bacterium]